MEKVAEEAGPDIATSISKLSKGEMKAFHATFVAADKSLDERVCKNGSNGGDENTNKCKTPTTGTTDKSDNNLGHE